MKFKTPAVAIAAFIAGSVAIPSVVGAQTDATPTEDTVPAEVIGVSEGTEFDLEDPQFSFEELSEADLAEFEDYEPTAEELAQWNAETDELVKALTEAGIDVPVETDESGVRYPAFSADMSEADWEKVDAVLADVYGEFDGTVFGGNIFGGTELDFENYEPTAEELAEWNAETEAFIAELEAAGIPVERSEEDGFLAFDIPEELTAAQEEALEGFFGDCEELEVNSVDGGIVASSVLEV